jgi:hypothetical protein
LELLRERIEDWFRRKSYLPKDAALVVTEPSEVNGRKSEVKSK